MSEPEPSADPAPPADAGQPAHPWPDLPRRRALVGVSLAWLALTVGLMSVFPGPHSLFVTAPDPFFGEWTVPAWLAELLDLHSARAPAFTWGWAAAPAAAAGLIALALRGARLPVPAQAIAVFLLGWLSLALWPAIDGGWSEQLQRPLHHPHDYWQDAGRMGLVDGELRYPTPEGGLPFFAAYPELQTAEVMGMHARTHPPLAVYGVYRARRAGLGALGTALLLPAAGAALAVTLLLFLASWLGPRQALPGAVALLLTPQLGLYAATSLDAVFALTAGGAALAYVHWLRRGRPAALAGFGVAWGLTSGLSFAALTVGLFLVLVSVAAWLAGRREALVRAGLGVAAGLLGIGLVAALGGWSPPAVLGAALEAQAPLEARWDRVAHPLYWRWGGALAYSAALGFPLAALALLRLGAPAWTRERLDPFRGDGLLVAAVGAVLGLLATGLVLGEAERLLLVFTPLVIAGLAPTLARLQADGRGLGWLLAALTLQTTLVEIGLDTAW